MHAGIQTEIHPYNAEKKNLTSGEMLLRAFVSNKCQREAFLINREDQKRKFFNNSVHLNPSLAVDYYSLVVVFQNILQCIMIACSQVLYKMHVFWEFLHIG